MLRRNGGATEAEPQIIRFPGGAWEPDVQTQEEPGLSKREAPANGFPSLVRQASNRGVLNRVARPQVTGRAPR